MIAKGSRISSLAHVKGHKEDTTIAWIQDAAEHAEAIVEVLMAEYSIECGQMKSFTAFSDN